MVVIIPKGAAHLEKLITGRTRQWLANGGLGTASTALIENYIDSGGWVPAHSHGSEELLLCLVGEGKLLLNGEAHDFLPGATAVIPAGAIHEVQNVGEGVMHMLGFFPCAQPTIIWVE